jgi:hypothetical protein
VGQTKSDLPIRASRGYWWSTKPKADGGVNLLHDSISDRAQLEIWNSDLPQIGEGVIIKSRGSRLVVDVSGRQMDIDLAAITQAGGWKSTRMPLQYAEKINVARSGMAKAAEKTGRDL